MIRINIEGSIYSILLDRPECKNALNPEFVSKISKAILSIPKDARGLVIRSTSDTFCAGADLNWIRAGHTQSDQQNYEESRQLAELLTHIQACPIPVISVVQGAAIGAGAGIMLSSDFSIVHKSTILSFSEVKIGVVPVAIIELLLNYVPLHKARHLLLTGRRVFGADLSELSITDNIVESIEEAESVLKKLLEELSEAKPEAVANTKQLIDAALGQTLDNELIAREIASLRRKDEALDGINRFFS